MEGKLCHTSNCYTGGYYELRLGYAWEALHESQELKRTMTINNPYACSLAVDTSLIKGNVVATCQPGSSAMLYIGGGYSADPNYYNMGLGGHYGFEQRAGYRLKSFRYVVGVPGHDSYYHTNCQVGILPTIDFYDQNNNIIYTWSSPYRWTYGNVYDVDLTQPLGNSLVSKIYLTTQSSLCRLGIVELQASQDTCPPPSPPPTPPSSPPPSPPPPLPPAPPSIPPPSPPCGPDAPGLGIGPEGTNYGVERFTMYYTRGPENNNYDLIYQSARYGLGTYTRGSNPNEYAGYIQSFLFGDGNQHEEIVYMFDNPVQFKKLRMTRCVEGVYWNNNWYYNEPNANGWSGIHNNYKPFSCDNFNSGSGK